MLLEDIFSEFRALSGVRAKTSYMREIAALRLNYRINWDKVIAAWERHPA